MKYANKGRGATGVNAFTARRAQCLLAAICALFVTIAAFLVAPLTPVANADPLQETGSITVNYVDNGTAISGANAKLYHVADWTSDSKGFTGLEQYDDASVSWDLIGKDSDAYRQTAVTLTNYIASKSLDPDQSLTTKADGTAVFSELPRGLYLVVIDPVKVGDLSCKTSSTLAFLPVKADDGKLTMNLTLNPKTDCTTPPTPPSPPEEKTVERTVRKVWNDDNDSAKKRPTKITVALLRDGETYDTVELNEANNWKHTWTGLAEDHEWSVTEVSVPDGYTTLTDPEGVEFIITNTYTPPETPPNTPPETPPTETPPNKPPEELKKTGANVTTLSASAVGIAGVGLVLLGAVRRKHRKDAQQGSEE
ncbi:adhesin [Bifidobacterium goeldii]|uniref:Adhesin n=1 Tax=Bifidobacterium goeldii TaxID=2306975 RepID=A0A430FCR3_9BIFI|nr:Cna B-type domain-containing protein [Bifidobacterium goeldii]RSX50582.1 adhesin [Bifidobacterium goeldii]